MSLQCLIDLSATPPIPDALYNRIDFPEAPTYRPYVYINMVSTVDGKIVIGDIGGSAAGLGGETDQLLFRRLQHSCDAAMIGGGTLRSSQVLYPPAIKRIVVTRTGDLPLDNRFFLDAPEKVIILAPLNLEKEKLERLKARFNIIQTGDSDVNLTQALSILRNDHEIKHLLCEGGATLNDQLLRAGLADELFLTLAPKLKGGKTIPTIVDGVGFPAGFALPMRVVSLYRDGDEFYFRYRIGEKPAAY